MDNSDDDPQFHDHINDVPPSERPSIYLERIITAWAMNKIDGILDGAREFDVSEKNVLIKLFSKAVTSTVKDETNRSAGLKAVKQVVDSLEFDKAWKQKLLGAIKIINAASGYKTSRSEVQAKLSAIINNSDIYSPEKKELENQLIAIAAACTTIKIGDDPDALLNLKQALDEFKAFEENLLESGVINKTDVPYLRGYVSQIKNSVTRAASAHCVNSDIDKKAERMIAQFLDNNYAERVKPEPLPSSKRKVGRQKTHADSLEKPDNDATLALG